MPKLKIVTEGGSDEFENDDVDTIADLVDAVKDTLNLGDAANFAVNGRPADRNFRLSDGDEVSTTKPAGRKGEKA